MAYRQNQARKKAMLEALEKTLGIVTHAAKIAGINRNTHMDWMRKDPDYRTKVEGLKDITLDFAESCLHKRMKSGSDAAIIFYLKTIGKSRGYTEGIISEQKGNISIVVSGDSVKDAIDLL